MIIAVIVIQKLAMQDGKRVIDACQAENPSRCKRIETSFVRWFVCKDERKKEILEGVILLFILIARATIFFHRILWKI